MGVDLNKMAENMKKRKKIGVTREGQLVDDPKNDGANGRQNEVTTLEPERFWAM